MIARTGSPPPRNRSVRGGGRVCARGVRQLSPRRCRRGGDVEPPRVAADRAPNRVLAVASIERFLQAAIGGSRKFVLVRAMSEAISDARPSTMRRCDMAALAVPRDFAVERSESARLVRSAPRSKAGFRPAPSRRTRNACAHAGGFVGEAATHRHRHRHRLRLRLRHARCAMRDAR